MSTLPSGLYSFCFSLLLVDFCSVPILFSNALSLSLSLSLFLSPLSPFISFQSHCNSTNYLHLFVCLFVCCFKYNIQSVHSTKVQKLQAYAWRSGEWDKLRKKYQPSPWTSVIVCVFDQGSVLSPGRQGRMSDREAERAGLVTTHVYSVLTQHVKVRILRSVAVKCFFFLLVQTEHFLWSITSHFVEAKEMPGLRWAYAQPELQFLFFFVDCL